MGNESYLFAALAVTLLGVVGYVYYLGQRVRELRSDLLALEEQERREGSGAGSGRA